MGNDIENGNGSGKCPFTGGALKFTTASHRSNRARTAAASVTFPVIT